MNKRLVAFATATLLLGTISTVQAMEILPANYSIDKTTDCGSYCYHDETGIQLIDGAYGVAPWHADLGNGNAYEWLGWVHDSPVNIDFDFLTTTAVDSINVGTVQDHPNDVVVPSIEIFSSTDAATWSSVSFLDNSPESSANNNTYFTFTLGDLGISARYVRVSLTHAVNGPWTFVDEVDFFVPEPTTLALLGLGLAGFGFRAGRKKFN